MKIILVNKNEIPATKIEPDGSGLKIIAESTSVDEVESKLGDSDNMDTILCADDSGSVFGKYYNQSLVSIVKADGAVIVRTTVKKVEASVDVAAVLSDIQTTVSSQVEKIATIQSDQEVQDGAIADLAAVVAESAGA